MFNFYRERVVVQDNTGPMVELIIVNVTDGDEPNTPNSQINLSIDNDFGLFAIENHTIVTQTSLSGARLGEYNIRIVAQDGGMPQQSAMAMFIIEVVNTNENPPVFNIPSYFNLTENRDGCDPFTVTDGDSGNEGIAMLPMISGEFASNFSIIMGNSTNEFALQTVVPLDREEEDSLLITLTVSDSGTAMFRQTATTNVTINVNDINDNSPVIENPAPGVRIPVAEASPSGHFLYQVNATDRDSGINAELAYGIESATGGADFPFTIDSMGQISTTHNISDNVGTTFNVTIIVTDGGSPMLSTNITVYITVTETNNNEPVFSSLPTNVSIDEDTAVNDIVIQDFSVTDADEGEAGTFSVELEQAGTYFSLLGSSIYLNQEVDYEVI